MCVGYRVRVNREREPARQPQGTPPFRSLSDTNAKATKETLFDTRDCPTDEGIAGFRNGAALVPLP